MSVNCFKSIIAGPCSAESMEICMSVADAFAESGIVDIFRAGIWKPRSLSGMYEGPGEEGLSYLVAVKQKHGMKTATEVATPAHVEACLKADIDVLWLGARTVTDPFSVQLLADALEGTGVEVMIKNPVIPDIRLWIGAAERFIQKGIHVSAFINRGVALYEKSIFRNEPAWAMASEMRRIFPDVRLIADPSHMAGTAGYIKVLVMQALEMEVDGLMIEVHPNPGQALSDAQQQLHPDEFSVLMKHACSRSFSLIPDPMIEQLRKSIDDLDAELLNILSKRIAVVRQLGLRKKQSGLTLLQGERWNEVVHSRIEAAKLLQMEPSFVAALLKVIHDESLRIQIGLQGEDKEPS